MRGSFDVADFDEQDGKATAAAKRFRLARVERVDDAFEEVFGALAAEFGPRGEIERREVVERWLAEGEGRLPGPRELLGEYALLEARAPDGSLAGARDVHVTVDVTRRIVVAYLSHVLVLPAHRRSGLGALLRAAPLTLARAAAEKHGLAGAELLLAAEMEPADPVAEDTRIRLVAYGRAGFSAMDPDHIAYEQPDFRDPVAIGASPQSIPLLAVIRRLGHEGETLLPKRLGEAFLEHLYAVFATHALPEHLAPSLARSRSRLAAAPDPLPLLALPATLDDADRFVPLQRTGIPHGS